MNLQSKKKRLSQNNDLRTNPRRVIRDTPQRHCNWRLYGISGARTDGSRIDVCFETAFAVQGQ